MAGVPALYIADVDPERDVATVYSCFLAGRDGPQIDRPLFWTLDLATGEEAPVQPQWAANDTLLLPVATGSYLLALERIDD